VQDQAKTAAIVPTLQGNYVNADQIQARVKLLGDSVDQQGNVQPGQISQAMGIAAKLSNNATYNSATAHAPGSYMSQYLAQVEPIVHQLALSDVQAMARAGVKFGRITNTEFNALGNAYANLTNPNQTRGQLIRNLQTVKRLLPKVVSSIEIDKQGIAQQIKTLGGSVPATGPAAQPQSPQVTDAQAALQWAQANPNDPRAAQVMARAHKILGQ